MSGPGTVLLAAYVGVLALLVRPLGTYMAKALTGDRCLLTPVLKPLERALYRVARVRPDEEMGWKRYAVALLLFNGAGLVATYLLQRFQGSLPGNPAGQGAVPVHLAANTAVSFVTNTNWQAYGGETSMSHLTQALALCVQNFLSAATGLAVLLALARGVARRSAASVGSFWADLVRGTLYVLLPLSLLLALGLCAEGVVQSWDAPATATLVEPTKDAAGAPVARQTIPQGPAASQVAIKMLGTNGGGFFNANSAHPYENPTPLSGFLECLAILLIPAASCVTFGLLVGDRRQGWAILGAMTVLWLVPTIACIAAEEGGNPRLAALGADASPGADRPGGNMEGKELRFGPAASALWATATTAASNGSVEAMHDSFTPIGGLWPLLLMQLGEVAFGGVGSGLYGMLLFAFVTVFVCGLMVGRTPEYLGKKVEAFEMKMASLAILLPSMVVLVGTAVAVSTPDGLAGIGAPGPHGFTQVLYAFSSAGNNNGSAFGGLAAGSAFYDGTLALAMLVGRFGVAIPTLAIAGSLAAKKRLEPGPGTLPTHGPLFVALLVAVVVLVGALTFLPSLALGPIVEQLRLSS